MSVLVLSAVSAVVAIGAYVSPFLGRSLPVPSELTQGNISEALVVESDESFPVPVPAHWLVDVVGVLEGGRAFVLERIDKSDGGLFYGYIEGVLPDGPPDGFGTVHGLWRGSTCAYQHTVFRGECVPEVQIRHFEPLADGLPQ